MTSALPLTPPAPAAGRQAAGYSLLAWSVLCNGIAIHLTRAAASRISVLWVTTVLCLSGPLAGLLIALLLRRLRLLVPLATVTPDSVARQVRQRPRALLLAAAAGAIGCLMMVLVIARHGPEVAAFLANLTVVFMVVAGVWRGERLGRLDLIAIALVVGGAFLVAHQRGMPLVGSALGLMTVACLGSAVKQGTVRAAVVRADLPSFVPAKQLAMGALLGIAALATDGWHAVLQPAIAWAVAAGVLQSAIGMPLLYLGFEAVGLARGAPIDALRPLVVLVIGVLLGAPLPGCWRLLGAAAVITGAVLLASRGVRHGRRTAAIAADSSPASAGTAALPAGTAVPA